MKLADIDWRVMRGSAILLIVATLSSGGMVSGANYFENEMQRELKREQRKLNAIRSEFQTIDEQRLVIEQYLPRFRSLEAKGIIGEERRLDWIETLRVAAEQVQLISLRYQIGRQQKYLPHFPIKDQGFGVFASQMVLDMGLLHEEDLLRMLRELTRRTTSLYDISECNLTRTNQNLGKSPERPNLRASCDLQWLTLQLDAKPT